jgi:hypothetical protein
MPDVPVFRPSSHGFAFRNAWPAQPALTLDTPLGRIPIGDARGGLCGGMVFAALDYFYAGAQTPPDMPAAGEPLYRFIVSRLMTSWDLPRGPLKYYDWMRGPDEDSRRAMLGLRLGRTRGLAWRTIVDELPRIRARIDHGDPACLGVVMAHSSKPADLGHNHQVLAWGYDVVGDRITVKVYDPNRGRRDDIWISFSLGAPSRPTVFEHNLGTKTGLSPRGLFHVAYQPVAPPVAPPVTSPPGLG